MRLSAKDNILMVTACKEHDFSNFKSSNMIPFLIQKSQEAVLSQKMKIYKPSPTLVILLSTANRS